ncbi:MULTISPECIES: hypothetical protein [unclassified Microbacterium]|uniref:hypothetical protein n=1 Tax=unclassified Microbacterium TaxID=2609290 RepID=UPI003018B6E9
MSTEPIELLYERLKVIEREMGAIRAAQIATRPQWPAIAAAIAAVLAIIVTIADKL